MFSHTRSLTPESSSFEPYMHTSGLHQNDVYSQRFFCSMLIPHVDFDPPGTEFHILGNIFPFCRSFSLPPSLSRAYIMSPFHGLTASRTMSLQGSSSAVSEPFYLKSNTVGYPAPMKDGGHEMLQGHKVANNTRECERRTWGNVLSATRLQSYLAFLAHAFAH